MVAINDPISPAYVNNPHVCSYIKIYPPFTGKRRKSKSSKVRQSGNTRYVIIPREVILEMVGWLAIMIFGAGSEAGLKDIVGNLRMFFFFFSTP